MINWLLQSKTIAVTCRKDDHIILKEQQSLDDIL